MMLSRCSLGQLLVAMAVVSMFGCAGPEPRGLDPERFVFGAPSTGGLLLFAENGQFEIWRTDHNINFADASVVAAGNLGTQSRLVGLGIGRRHTLILDQRDDGQLRLLRLGSGGLDPTPILLSSQPPQSGWKARSFALYLRNPKNCLEGQADYLMLMERPTVGDRPDEVWIVSEDGLVRQQMTFQRPANWIPVAVGTGAVESSNPWILFARSNGMEAKLVQTRDSPSGNELLLTANEVPFVPLGTPSTGHLSAASGFGFATSVRDNRHRDGNYVYWWQIYRWRSTPPSPHSFRIRPEAGASGYPPDSELALIVSDSPPGLDLVAYADRRPTCMTWESHPLPERFQDQFRSREKDGLEAVRPTPNIGQ